MLDQALLLELGERTERFGNRLGLRTVEPAHPKVDHVERVEAEICQVVVDGLAQLVVEPARVATRPEHRASRLLW